MAKVTTEEELANAIKNDEDTIEIEGNLANKTIKIKATGKVAWAIAIAAIAIAVASILLIPASGGTSSVASGAAISGAASILGGKVTLSAIAIAVAGGGVGILNKLRKYRIEKISDKHIILHKK